MIVCSRALPAGAAEPDVKVAVRAAKLYVPPQADTYRAFRVDLKAAET